VLRGNAIKLDQLKFQRKLKYKTACYASPGRQAPPASMPTLARWNNMTPRARALSSLSDSSDVSHETDTESPLSSYSPIHENWHSVIYEDSDVLTSGREACIRLCDGVEGGIGLGMRVASSLQSIWDISLIVPPNSPMMRERRVQFPIST
jgi:hypothetical protein